MVLSSNWWNCLVICCIESVYRLHELVTVLCYWKHIDKKLYLLFNCNGLISFSFNVYWDNNYQIWSLLASFIFLKNKVHEFCKNSFIKDIYELFSSQWLKDILPKKKKIIIFLHSISYFVKNEIIFGFIIFVHPRSLLSLLRSLFVIIVVPLFVTVALALHLYHN